MAEVLLSPGVLARENDNSFLTRQPVEVGMALVTPTVKGRVNIPTIITSYSDYVATYGTTFTSGSDTYTFLGSTAAYNYFQQGGTSLLVTRVMTGSWSPATCSFFALNTSESFTLETLSEGDLMNNSGSADSNQSLTLGTKDNVRAEIVSPDTSSGTFSVLIRRGNDNIKSKVILESFNNVNLDPNSPNYIERVIGNQTYTLKGSGTTDVYLQATGSYPNASKYVRVSGVAVKTPDYLDNSGNPKAQYTASIPVAASGTFTGGTGDVVPSGVNKYYEEINTNTQGLTAACYDDVFYLLQNKDEYQYNVIAVPGLIYSIAAHKTSLNILIDGVQNNGNAIVIADLATYGSTVTSITSTAAEIDSSYVASYHPWLQVTDPNSGKLTWVPPSTLILGAYQANDRIGEPWFAPAGVNRGGLSTVNQAEVKLSEAKRDSLYTKKVNPIATFPRDGVVVWGNKTLQAKPSALDRVNVRRLLITLKSYTTQVARNLVFDNNTIALRNQFLSIVNPYMESVKQRQGLYAFKVIMDDSNNTPDVIDRNELRGQFFIQPSKAAEFIYLDFNIQPTGATFPE